MANRVLRTFLALEIPPNIRSQLSTQRNAVREDLPRARWTRPQAWHLTLKFLGDSECRVLDELKTDLRPRLIGIGAIQVRLGGTGFFPSPSRPRVGWVGGAAEGIEGVVEAVETSARSVRIPPEKRRWGLHLTLARIRDRWSPEAVDRFLEWGEALDFEPFTCNEVVLFSSDLRPDGAVYTAMERFTLE